MTNQEIKVGSVLKCYDFRRRTDCYKIGRVVQINKYERMVLDLIEDVWEGEPWSGLRGIQFATFLPGHNDIDWEGRIEVIG